MFNQSKLFVYPINVVVNVSLNHLYSKKKNNAQGFLFVVRNNHPKVITVWYGKNKEERCLYYLVSIVDNDDGKMDFLISKHRRRLESFLSSDRLSLFTNY
jgi:hypothetical protein